MMHRLDKLKHVTSILYALTFYALLTMNIERYIAVKYPIYHKTSLTKAKLVLAFVTFLLLVLMLRVLSATGVVPSQLPSSITFFVLLIIMLPTNLTMYCLAKRTVKIRKAARIPRKRIISQNNNTAQEKISENGNNSFQESDKLSEENDKLSEKSDKLSEKKDCLSDKKSDQLSKESSQLSEKSEELSTESTNLSKQNEKMQEKLNSFQGKHCKIQNKRPKLSLKNVSVCILAVASFTLCALPGMVFNGLNIIMGKEWFGEKNFELIVIWVRTLLTLNSSFNSLVFFWKNAILRTEGKRVLRKRL